MKISAVLKAYQNDRRSNGYSPETIDRVVINVQLFCRDTHIASVERMTTGSVLVWGNTKLQEGRKQSTVYAYYNSIKSLVCYMDECKISHNLDKSRLRCKPIYERLTVLRPGDVRRIAAAGDNETALLVRMMYTSGMRISEAISLTPAMIDGTELYITGKGGKVRTVFLTEELVQGLKTLQPPTGEPFFALNRSAAYYKIKKAMVEAGYPTAYPHSLRHTFTTTMLRNGATLSHVQRLLGHSSIETTQRYEHLVTDDIRRAHSKYLAKV